MPIRRIGRRIVRGASRAKPYAKGAARLTGRAIKRGVSKIPGAKRAAAAARTAKEILGRPRGRLESPEE